MVDVGEAYLRRNKHEFSAFLEVRNEGEGIQYNPVDLAPGIPGMVAVIDSFQVRITGVEEGEAFDSCGVTVGITTTDTVAGVAVQRYVAAAQAATRFEAATAVLLREREADTMVCTQLALAGLRARRPAEPWNETMTGPFGAPGAGLIALLDPVVAAEGGIRPFTVQLVGHYEPVTQYRVTLKTGATFAAWYAQRDGLKWCSAMTSNSATTDGASFTRTGRAHRLEQVWSNGRIRALLASDFALIGEEQDGEIEAVLDRVVVSEQIGSRWHVYPGAQPVCGETIRMQMTPGAGAVGLGWASGSYDALPGPLPTEAVITGEVA